MSHFLILLCVFLSSHLFATHIFFDAHALDTDQKSALFERAMSSEPPRKQETDIEHEIRIEWISPTAWQIAVLHAFFHDQEIHDAIVQFEPLTYEEALHRCLLQAKNNEEIKSAFTLPSALTSQLNTLFFQINQAIVTLYERAARSQETLVRLALSELPPFEEWQERGFPFWNSPWIYNPNSAKIFHSALMDEELLNRVIEIEKLAYKKGEWVLYRGYSGSGYPTTLQIDGSGSHALSFGSTLLGGTFFSLEASALTYAKPHIDQGEWSFLALRVTFDEMQQIFRVGPLHPFLQMFADGEMFHAHTKIARDSPSTNLLDGYFMACNKKCEDNVGYILALHTTPEQLEAKFQALCHKSGTVFGETTR